MDKKGFTLIEVLIATTISTMMLLVIMGVYVNSLKILDSALKTAQVTNNGQLDMETMTREIRNATSIVNIVSQQIGGAGGHNRKIIFQTPDEAGNIAYNLQDNTLYWSTAPGQRGNRILVRNVSFIKMEGFCADDNFTPITNPPVAIRAVKITLTTTDDNGGSPQDYFSFISVRNL